MRVPDSTSLPPRGALPRDIEIPAVPELGRTWYDRGGKYWTRRAALAFMWAVVLLVIVLIDVGIFCTIRQSSAAAFVVLLAIDAAVAVAVLATPPSVPHGTGTPRRFQGRPGRRCTPVPWSAG